MSELNSEGTSRQRPHTSHVPSRSAERRSVAAAFLDLRPLPEGTMLDSKALSFDSIGNGYVSSVKSQIEEEGYIREKLHGRLPSASSFDAAVTRSKISKRPSTAPTLGDFDRSKDNLLGASANARSARYLAIQWRSRATQLNLSHSMSDISKDTAPSPARVSDGSESDSNSVSSESSDVSAETMDESIRSQVSDAQKVVEKWQQRWSERSESYSVCSETASRDEEEETDTLKMRGSRDDFENAFGFAMRPASSAVRKRALITNDSDNVRIVSALKPEPLPPVSSGREFLSQSQLNRLNGLDEDDDYDELPGEVKRGATVLTEGGKVVMRSVEETQSVDNDDNLSDSDSSKDMDEDDQLSESSTVHQSLSRLNTAHDARDMSFDMSQNSSKEDTKAVIQTFCNLPEPLSPMDSKMDNKKLESSEEQNLMSMKSEAAAVTPKRKTKKAFQDAHVEEKKTIIEPLPVKPSSKEAIQYTGSVQERIEAVKLAKKAAKKKVSSRPSSSSSSKNKKRRPQPGNKTKQNKESTNSPTSIKWTEHDVIFTFGLLTSIEDAPPTGKYHLEDEQASSYKNKLKTKSRLLYDILSNFSEIIRRTKSLGNGSTKYMMCSPDCTPRPLNVKRDGKFNPQFIAPEDRPKIKRSIVKACVPIFVPKDNMQAQEVATHVVLDLFAVAISKGEFSGLRFEKIS